MFLNVLKCSYVHKCFNVLKCSQMLQDEVPVLLSAEQAQKTEDPKISLDEAGFRWLHNEDEMAVHKLSEVLLYFVSEKSCIL